MKKIFSTIGIILLMGGLLCKVPCAFASDAAQLISQIPIQHEGRMKSFDVFARETLRQLAGKETWQKEPASLFIFKHLAHPRELLQIPLVRLDNLPLKDHLGLPADRKYFSYMELKPSLNELTALAASGQKKRDDDLKPTQLEQKAEFLYKQMVTLDKLIVGELLQVIPPDGKGRAWSTPKEAANPLAAQFRQLTTLYAAGQETEFVHQTGQWIKETARYLSPHTIKTIRLENVYYRIKAFRMAWILYLIAFIALVTGRPLLRKIGYGALAAGLIYHSLGLILRCLILSRPPVSNMFESMIFMNWILMVSAVIYFLVKKVDYLLEAGALASVLVMIYADLLPIERSLGVLVPVLRSNYWLTLHVLTVVSSYGIFGLCMALGHRQLFLSALGRIDAQQEKLSAHLIYRLIQAGVIALGVGTFLGGIWANESWGRFWGWDPKETWALITFLGYMVVVHLRATNKLNNFWVAACSLLGFLLVLMTWYGVNFLLGKGLHSYGFGSGGTQWVLCYLIFELFFLVFVFIKKYAKPGIYRA